MASNLDIDIKLLEEALSLGGLRTKKATVNQALREFIARRNQLAAIEEFGTFEFDPSFDYKAQRAAR
jgi:Arc/MetJ family transcription regulator